MYTVLTKFPDALTNKSWQKKKSFLDKAKAKTKTGLGTELEAVEKSWDKINWPSLDATQAMGKVDQSAKYKSAKEFDFAKAVGESEVKGQVAVVRKNLLKVSKLAHTTSQNKDLSKDAIKKAQEIARGLLDLETGLRDIDLSDFDEKKSRWLELQAMQLKGLKKAVLELEVGLTAVAKDPTVDNWNNKVKQKFRSVGNTLGNNDAFKEDWKVWINFDGLQIEKDPALKVKGITEEAQKKIVLGHVKTAIGPLQKLKVKVAKM